MTQYLTMRNHLFCFGSLFIAVSLNLSAADSAGQAEPAKTAAPKSFQIRNHKYGNLLRPEDANSADGTPIVLYPAQPWKCMTWTFHPSGESRFQLQNLFTAKTFAAKSGDSQAQAPVSQVPFAKNPDGRPTWQVTRLSDGSYKITDARSGQALTAAKEESSSRCRIVLTAWSDAEDQKWDLTEIDPKTLTM